MFYVHKNHLNQLINYYQQQIKIECHLGGISIREIKSIKSILVSKLKELDKAIAKAEKSLKKAPKGSLIVSKSNGCVQFYQNMHEGESKRKYIYAENDKLVHALAQKDYDKLLLKTAIIEKKHIQNILRYIEEKDTYDVYNQLNPHRKKLIESHYLNDKEFVKQWLTVQYNGKDFEDESSEIITERGERVRSKSEKIIADKLDLMGIPYLYEYPLKLKGFGIVYPDFTMLNMVTRKEVYMEHFGMMDNPEYCQKAISKIEQYEKNGIFIGKNLIVTFETSKQLLNMSVVENMLKEVLML